MENNTILGYRKFYKLRSLKCCLQQGLTMINGVKSIYYNGKLKSKSELSANGIENIDIDTILFITASNEDTGKYVCVNSYTEGVNLKDETSNSNYVLLNEGDTVFWIKGEFYSISSKGIKDVVAEENSNEEKNLIFTFSDGTKKTINLNELVNNYIGVYPILVEDNTISLQGITVDGDNKNIIEFENAFSNNIKHTHVEGVGNTSTADYQHIQGKYSEQDNSSIFIIGGGENENNRKNLLTVGFDGITRAENDIIANGNKLSDIHNVTDTDWVIIGEQAKLNFSNAFDASFK
jgi:hypothetical protein